MEGSKVALATGRVGPGRKAGETAASDGGFDGRRQSRRRTPMRKETMKKLATAAIRACTAPSIDGSGSGPRSRYGQEAIRN